MADLLLVAVAVLLAVFVGCVTANALGPLMGVGCGSLSGAIGLLGVYILLGESE